MKIEIQNIITNEIDLRSSSGKILAEKFSELKGLSYVDFLKNCPLELDFITSNEMYEALNK